jgi:HK97 family phage portal protein
VGDAVLSWIERLLGRDEKKAVEFTEGWLDAAFGYSQSWTGEPVTISTALQVPAFYRAVMVIADGIAQLPIVLMRPVDGGMEPATDHPLYDLFARKTNAWQDASEWTRTTMMHKASTGCAVSWRNVVNGQIRELIPIKPDNVQIVVRQDLELEYTISLENSRTLTLSRGEVFHLRSPSWDSARGLDPVLLGRQALGLAQASERSQAALHKNGVRTTGLFTLDGNPSEEQRDRVRQAIASMYGSAANTGKPVLASGALKFTPTQMTGVDAQHLETRKHQIEEIARLMGVFSIMLGHAGNNSPTFASAEAFFAAHVRYTLQPEIKALTAALNAQLLTDDEWRAGLRFTIDTSELLRGSLKDRAEYYDRAIRGGWMTRNEAREDDGWNPLDGLDKPLFPLNMGEVAGQGSDADVASPVDVEDDDEDDDNGQKNPWKPTDEMAAAARRALAWRSEFGRGGTAIGIARARDISNGRRLPRDTIMRMVGFFARHEVDKRAEGFREGEPGFPSNGRIAWDLWGGDAGRAWANRIADRIEELGE